MSVFKSFKRSANGAKVPHLKNTSDCPTVKMPLPTKIVVPMQMHIGAQCTPCVKKGDWVFVGSVIGKGDGAISADIHSGVSGTVDSIEEVMFPNGCLVPCITIIPDGNQIVDSAVKPPVVTDYSSFIKAVRDSGLVGLGGAGFPTSVKLSPKNMGEIDTLIINGAECEPYITADNREFIEHPEDIMAGIEAVRKYLGIKNVKIAIERNKPQAIDIMFSLTKGDATLQVCPLDSKYPQGAEKIVIEKTTGREVPQGGLPSDVNVIVMNVSTVAFIARYLETGMPLTTKRVTVDGDIVAKPQNVETVIGTPFNELLSFCGGITATLGKLIMGGPMMGTAVVNDAFPVLKQTNAVIAFSEEKARLEKPQPCIRCARCINACPMGLSPVEIVHAHRAGDMALVEKLSANLCMECGTCSYVCPAKRPVAQAVGLAKADFKAYVKGGKK